MSSLNVNPKRYYISTRNITEMKLDMLDEDIEFNKNSHYYNLFKKNNKEIEEYFSKISKRRKKLLIDKEAIYYSKVNKVSQQLSYRKILLGSEWSEAEEWIRFYWLLGEYIEKTKDNFSIFISYISTEIPALILCLAILDIRYKKFENIYSDSEVKYEFKEGERISYLNSSKNNDWRDAKIIKVEYFKGKSREQNPYLKIEIAGNKKEGTLTTFVPRNQWESKIRKGGKVKGVGGRGTQVRVNDVISEIISERYGQSVTERLRVTPRCHVNLIGRQINSWYRDMRESIQFSDSLGSFLLSDLLYLDNDDESNFINVHVVSSEKTNVKVDADTISIFVGSKSALDFGDSATNKNIYLTSREKVNLVEDNNILVNNLRQKTVFSNEDKNKKEEQIKLYLKNEGVGIPRGVEISVF